MSKEAAPAPSPMRTLLNLLPLIIVTLYLCQNRPDKDPKYVLEECGQQLHSIGVSVEKDRLLSEGKLYNTGLKEIFGKKPVPACPVGGEESYIDGYQVAEDKRSYLLVCKGDHHTEASVPSDYPRIAFSVEEAKGNGQEKDVEPKGAEPDPGQSPEIRATEGDESQPKPTVESEGQPEDPNVESEKTEEPKLQNQDQEESAVQEQSAGEEQKAEEPQVSATPASSPKPE